MYMGLQFWNVITSWYIAASWLYIVISSVLLYSKRKQTNLLQLCIQSLPDLGK